MADYSVDAATGLINVRRDDGSVIQVAPQARPGLEAAGITAVDDPNAGGGASRSYPGFEIVDDPAAAERLRQQGGAAVEESPSQAYKRIAAEPPRERKEAMAEAPVDIPDPPDQRPAASPVRRIPGEFTKVGETRQLGANITGEQIDAEVGAYQSTQDVLARQRDDMAIAQEHARQEAERAVLEGREQLDAQRARRLEIDSDINALAKRRDEAQAAAEAAAVDPAKLMGRAPWTVALAALAQGLQASANANMASAQIRMGQAPTMTFDSNFLQQALDADVARQKMLYEQAKDTARAHDSRYREALDLYGTPEDAAKAIEAQDLAMLQQWAVTQKSRVTDAQQLQAYDMQISELERMKQERITQLEDASAAKVTEQWAQQPDRYVGGGAKQKPAVAEVDSDLAELDAADRWAASLQARGETQVPGYGGNVVSRGLSAAGEYITGSPDEDVGQARKHVERVAGLVQSKYGKSDADAAKAKNEVLGNKTLVQFRKSIADQRARLKRKRAAAAGEAAPVAPGAVPGERR